MSAVERGERVALITGGGRRLGAVMAESLHQSRWRLVIHCRDSLQDAEQLVERLEAARPESAHLAVADLTDDGQVAQLAHTAVQVWGRLDGLVNNAALYYPTPLLGEGAASRLRQDAAAMRRMLEVNALAPLLLSRCLAAELRSRAGWIVNMLDAVPERGGHSAYDMSKAALRALSLALAKELAPVRVKAISPLEALPPVKRDRGSWRRREDWPPEVQQIARELAEFAGDGAAGQ